MSSSLPASSASATGLIAATIAIILLAANFTTINAQQEQQQQQQLTSQSSAIENRTATTTTTTRTQSTKDSISVQVPQGWIIQDVNNTGFALGIEVLQGYGILAQLCPEEEQQQGVPLPNASGNISSSSSTSTSSNSCQGAQEEVIHIVRYPNLGARLGISSEDVITTDDITRDTILAYQMQKLQEVGYHDIRIVNSTDTTINVISTGLNNNVIATVPAKLVEMTYSTNFAPNETRRGYLISTATDATPRNLGMVIGYTIFYEGNSTAADAQERTTLPSGSLRPLPPSVKQVFDSFELIAAPEVAQAVLVALAAQAEGEELADILTVEIISNGTEGVVPATFEFEADITGGTEPYTISWDFGDGSGGSDGKTVLLTFSEAGTYNIAVTAADSTGQTASDTIEITVEGPPTEESPTVEEPLAEETEETACDSSYPDMCIPPPPPNLTCDDVGARSFEVVPPDPHGFDGDNDGIGCESGSNPPDLDESDNNSGYDGSVDLGGLIDGII